MGVTEWMTGIGTILGMVGIGLLYKYTGLGEILNGIMGWIQKFLDWIFHLAKELRVLFWLLFIITIGGGMTSMILNIHYFCTTDDELRVGSHYIVDGIGLYINQFFYGWGLETEGTYEQNITYNDYILNNTYPYLIHSEGDYRSIFRIRCQSKSPSLTIFGIEPFNYQYWIMIFIIIGFVKVIQFFRR